LAHELELSSARQIVPEHGWHKIRAVLRAKVVGLTAGPLMVLGRSIALCTGRLVRDPHKLPFVFNVVATNPQVGLAALRAIKHFQFAHESFNGLGVNLC
jgi:hypothetical protein